MTSESPLPLSRGGESNGASAEVSLWARERSEHDRDAAFHTGSNTSSLPGFPASGDRDDTRLYAALMGQLPLRPRPVAFGYCAGHADLQSACYPAVLRLGVSRPREHSTSCTAVASAAAGIPCLPSGHPPSP